MQRHRPSPRTRLAHRLAGTLVLVGSLGACGGGGDDGHRFSPPEDDFNVAAAWHNLLTTSRTWSASGVGTDDRLYALTLSTSPGGNEVFPVTGESAARADVSAASTVDGVPADGLQQTFYDPASLAVIGLRSSITGFGTTCDVAIVNGTLPSAVKVGSGANGLLASLDLLDGCSADSPALGTIELNWSLEFETGTTYFCLTSTEHALDGQVLSVESDCLEVEPSGTLGPKIRVTVIQGGVSVTLRS